MKANNGILKERIFITLFFVFILSIIIISFIRISSSTTDENQWMDLPSAYYLTQDVNAESVNNNDTSEPKFIPAFNLIIRVNEVLPDNLSHFESIIKNSNGELLEFTILDIKKFKLAKYNVNKKDFDLSKVRLIDSAVIIRFIHKDGASDRAGLKVGDIITSINNRKFSNSMDADKIIRDGEIGKTLDYNIIRDGKEIEIKVFLAKYGVNFEYLLIIITGLAYIVLGFFISFNKPQIKAAIFYWFIFDDGGIFNCQWLIYF